LFTRWIINELALENRSYSDDTNFFKTINKMFSKDNPEKFWEKIVFYNFIQRAMAKNDKLNERPVKADYIIGWEVFFELISIVKPDVCLFLGSSMANYFNEYVIKSDVEHIKVIREEKINATYFKQSKVKINGLETSLYFVKHPSKYFSANKWLKKLKEKNTELVKHLT